MAVINGFLSSPRVFAGAQNPNITSDTRNFAMPWWPPQNADAGAAPKGALVTSWPVESSNAQAISGFIANAYSNDYYYRIHIIPSRLDLGNVVSTQTSTVNLWNAFFTPVTLLSIEGLDDGMTLSGQPALPLTFNALQQLAWSVAVTPDGSAVLDTALEWQFSNGSVADLNITGNRISAFPFLPDWTDGIIERLIWATDILQSRSGAEQRRGLRLSPRREFDIHLAVDGRERQAFDLAMFGWSSRVWAIPIWPDVQSLTAAIAQGVINISCSTTNRDFRAGGLAILRGENAFQYETVEILSFTSTQITLKRATVNAWPIGTRLYPVRSATLSAVQLTRWSDSIQEAQTLTFSVAETCDWPAVTPSTTYRGYPVFDAIPDESEDLTSQFQNLTLSLDSGTSLPRITDTAQRAFPLQQYRWFLNGRTERAAFRSLMYALVGRQVAMWVSTHADDLTLAALVTNTATSIDINSIGYTRYGQMRVGRRDIRVQLFNGTVFYRRITGASELSSSVERLQIDSSFGIQINLTDVFRISWLMLARQNSDTVEIDHHTDAAGVAKSQTVFRGVRDDDV